MEYFIRSGGFEGFADLVVELGGSPEAVLHDAGVSTDELSSADTPLPYRKFLSALALAARATGRPDFGLLLARRQSFQMLGAIGFAMREAPTIATAIDDLCTYFHTHSNGSRVRLERRRDHALWSYEIVVPDPPGFDQQIDLAAGIGVEILRRLSARSWTPELVCLQREKPRSTAQHEAFFGAPVLYGQEITGVVLDPGFLATPIAQANIQLHSILLAYLAQNAAAAPSTFQSRVRDSIWRGLRAGATTIDDVARDLQMTKRTFQRKLGAESIAFKELLEVTRMDMAKRMLKNSTASLTEISDMLGYSELAVFSRTFKRNEGVSPRQWRVSASPSGRAVNA